MTGPDFDFRPTCSMDNLAKRSELLHQTREFFRKHGFLEVQTPIVSRYCVVDQHLDPLVVLDSVDAEAGAMMRRRYLQTSPEASMKRLLAAGSPSIYQLGPVFRSGEAGRLHNPEFTMLEWYQLGVGYEEGMRFADELLRELLSTPAARTLSYQQAFLESTNLDPLTATIEQLAEWATEHQLVHSMEWSEHRDDWLDLIASQVVQPQLGREEPILLIDFPSSQAALAKTSLRDDRVCERFELFLNGIELANGYHELQDPTVFLQRSEQANADRSRRGKQKLPEHRPLFNAMSHGLPDCVGCALGFDRVVMLACGARSIDEVIPFPWDRA